MATETKTLTTKSYHYTTKTGSAIELRFAIVEDTRTHDGFAAGSALRSTLEMYVDGKWDPNVYCMTPNSSIAPHIAATMGDKYALSPVRYAEALAVQSEVEQHPRWQELQTLNAANRAANAALDKHHARMARLMRE
jgi:hypothetical protein